MTGLDPSAARWPEVTRRTFLRGVGSAGVLLGAGTALAACTRHSAAEPTASPTGPSKPRSGGQLRVGIVGAGKGESFNPSASASAVINVAMCGAVFDGFITIGPDLTLRPALVTEWTANAAATVWTFQLRPGVHWHDGKPFTADDVIYTLRWMGTSGNQLAPAVANVDLANLKKTGPLTVVVPMKRPYLAFPNDLAASGYVVQNGAKDFVKPIGTGPFVFESLSQGQRSVCRRNPDYWNHPKPYVDKLIIQSLTDDTARLNALRSGQIDVMAQVPFSQAKSGLGSGLRLLRSPGLAAYGFYMAVDKPPFDDARVRQALRLLVDRKQLVDVALDGFGTIGNDLFGKGLRYYDAALPQRTRDVAKAKALLAQAGHSSGLTVQLKTSPIVPGTVESATLFQQQARDGGVTVHISQVDPTSYFDPTRDYLKMAFAQTEWSGFATLDSFYQYALIPGAAGNETHWHSSHTTGLIQAAISATTPAAAKSAWAAVQQEQWDDGGYIWWANADNLDAASDKVAGITPSRYFNLGLPTGLADAYFTA